MVSCPGCKSEVPSSAITCPTCGYQLQTPKPIRWYEQSYLQRGPVAPRKVAAYALLFSIVVFVAFPAPWKVYGFAVAIALEIVQIARGCYGTGPITLVISSILAAIALGLGL
jgi:hypothetical protein